MAQPQYLVVLPPTEDEAALSLAALFTLLWRHGLLIALSGVIAALVAAYVVFNQPNVYRAAAVVAVRSGDGSAARDQIGSQLGGLASLAGVNLSSGGGERNELIAALTSRVLADRFIREQRAIPDLFWDRRDSSGRWKDKPPTPGEAVDRWLDDILNVNEDRKSGLVSVSVEDIDRVRAARWTNTYIALANRTLRAKQISEAQKTISYLRGQIAINSIEGVRQGLYRLIETNMNRAALASVSEEHPFAFVDRAVPPEPKKKIRPKRSVIVAVSGLIGTFVMAILIILFNWRKIILAPVKSTFDPLQHRPNLQ